MKKILVIIIAAAVGLTVLAGYFFKSQMSPILSMILDWGILLLGAAGFIGVGYLLRPHIRKIISHTKGAFLSVVVILAFVFTFTAGLIFSPQNNFYRDLILNVQIPVEASLLAIVAATLLYVSLRLIHTRGWTPMSIAFLLSSIASLILDLGFVQVQSDTLAAELISFLNRLPLVGARGILMGMALGGLVVGLRALLSIDHPYGD